MFRFFPPKNSSLMWTDVPCCPIFTVLDWCLRPITPCIATIILKPWSNSSILSQYKYIKVNKAVNPKRQSHVHCYVFWVHHDCLHIPHPDLSIAETSSTCSSSTYLSSLRTFLYSKLADEINICRICYMSSWCILHLKTWCWVGLCFTAHPTVAIHILDPDWYFKHSSHSNVYITVWWKNDFLIRLSPSTCYLQVVL